MARRLPSQPPVLPGFSTINILGSGGFADVFLYEQNMPRRQVAVKVLLSEVVDDHVRRMFQAEANLMAQLSSHPSILTVYQAGVSSDGRPYLVMELCSAALSERYRRERIPVAEVLRIAVKIGSAIETAHRAGVLHRDIKPSNILLTAYGHPVLSDFGIASTVSEVHTSESVGLSIPWSAPEVLSDETAGTISSEVWSFAATVYSLLAGRSPFEMAGEPNKTAELTSRILRARVHPTGRSDVPPTLERALARAMSRKPEARQQSVLELVRELQAIESELGLPQTAIEVAMDEWARPSVSDLEDRTRIRGAVGAPPHLPNRRRKRPAGFPATPHERRGSAERGADPQPRQTGNGLDRGPDRGIPDRYRSWHRGNSRARSIELPGHPTGCGDSGVGRCRVGQVQLEQPRTGRKRLLRDHDGRRGFGADGHRLHSGRRRRGQGVHHCLRHPRRKNRCPARKMPQRWRVTRHHVGETVVLPSPIPCRDGDKRIGHCGAHRDGRNRLQWLHGATARPQ
jgi:serine/threonine protein kinase